MNILSVLRRALVLSLFATQAHARAFIATPGAQTQPGLLASGLIGLSSYYDLEVGGKFAWKIADPGFVPMINNSVAIEGAGIVTSTGQLFIAPLLLWSFHLHPQWSVFAEAGIELGFSTRSKEKDRELDGGDPRGAHVAGTIGGFWRYSQSLWLRGELDVRHSSARAGLTWVD